MPNPMPFICATALTATLLLPSFATAAEDETALKPAMQRTSLGLRLGTTTSPTLSRLGGAAGLLGLIYNQGHAITVGIPVGESMWRVEPSLSASYSTSENSSSNSFSLGVMPQRVVATHTHGSLYAGAALTASRSSFTVDQTNSTEPTDTSLSFGVQPVLGMQAMLGESLSAGFEAGPQLNYTPESSTDSGSGEILFPSSLQISTQANLTIKYYF